ncbi:p-aminobenzoyl-glutamate transport protein [Vibrio stylophorae]|uniref:p-aminobenzoyl-glutamate transport protein n=1 Tax=Vibrio stylophorae TaxID=659351 RepID=A0ABM8ZRY4_9VIBR|nr:AbgT family transporter [Vibrio stylophorae]CAH0532878.1 p-aminobenzoyl-glutamate transport protein [Vibrio stylophorae]
MSEPTIEEHKSSRLLRVIEHVGQKIPDPVVIFMFLFVFCLALTGLVGGYTFETMGKDGGMVQISILNMLDTENVRWVFDNALLQNWLAFGGGVLGVILIVMLGIGIAENSGLLTAVIKKVGLKIPETLLPLLVVFLGIMSSIASDAGYLVLIPLAGLLYGALGKNPLIGMAAAFAGVSAGFSANLIPATPSDIILGMNARIFAESQNVPFTDASGNPLNPATMHYYFIAFSTVVLTIVGAWVTHRFVAPRLNRMSYALPEDINFDDFQLSKEEQKGLRWAGVGFIAALAGIFLLATGPLAAYQVGGKTITPYLNNIILLIAVAFAIPGLCFGVATGKFKSMQDVVTAMVKQMNTMGYILVLTFFCYNFLALLTYSNLGAYITYLGASFLLSLGLQEFPVLLILGFILTTAFINLFVGGLTSKWMLLGPIFVPMLYQVNPEMTPDMVTAAFRVADSCTNIITPMMSYAGVILAFMRKYKSDLSFGDMIAMMVPYSAAFLVVWSAILVAFFSLGIPLGF